MRSRGRCSAPGLCGSRERRHDCAHVGIQACAARDRSADRGVGDVARSSAELRGTTLPVDVTFASFSMDLEREHSCGCCQKDLDRPAREFFIENMRSRRTNRLTRSARVEPRRARRKRSRTRKNFSRRRKRTQNEARRPSTRISSRLGFISNLREKTLMIEQRILHSSVVQSSNPSAHMI